MATTNNEPIISGTKWTGSFSAQEIMNRHEKYMLGYVQKSVSEQKPNKWELLGEALVIPLWVIIVIFLTAVL